MKTMKPVVAALALAALVPLGACSQGETTTTASGEAENANKTLAAAIGGAPGLTTVSGALSEAGLADVFDGPGSYTVLAPDDDAFGKLGDKAATLTDEQHRAQLVAVLRGHILPGNVTPDAIKKAIAAKKGPVTMTTLADGTVTFSESGNDIAVAGSDGSKAIIDGAAITASNGVVLPIDGLIKKADPAPVT